LYDDAGNVHETHEHKGDFKEPWHDFIEVMADERWERLAEQQGVGDAPRLC
jgi:hypothetical protein